MRFVGDASALLSFVIADERGERSDALLAKLGSDPICVPVIWHAEILNGLIQAQRRGRIDSRGVAYGIVFFEALHICVDPVRPEMTAVRKLADAHKLSAYDATYLELAARESIPLATNDAVLARAARSHGVKTL